MDAQLRAGSHRVRRVVVGAIGAIGFAAVGYVCAYVATAGDGRFELIQLGVPPAAAVVATLLRSRQGERRPSD